MSQSQPVSWECAPAAARGGGVGREPVAASALAALLDTLPQPFLLVDAAATVRHANRAAEELLRSPDGLLVRDGKLVAADRSETLRLHRAVAVSAAGGAHDRVLLRRRAPETPLELLVWRIDSAKGSIGPLVAVYVNDRGRTTALSEPLLRQLYGLTRAEARLTALLANGQGVPEAAAHLRIGRSTARTHLQRVLAKTHTTRQAALVRLLLNGPAHLRTR